MISWDLKIRLEPWGTCGGKRAGGCQDSHRKPEDFQTPGTNLDFNGNDHRDELFIQLSQHHQLLQRQTAEPADGQTDVAQTHAAGEQAS